MKVINHDLSKDYENLFIYILADLHLGESLVDMRRVDQLLNEIKSNDNARLIVNGDLVNNGIKESVSDIYHETMKPSDQIKMLAQLLEPIKDKILVMTDGNHEARTSKKVGINLMETVAIELFGREKAEEIYSNEPYLLFLSFGRNRGRDERQTIYSMYGRHGSGGGRTVGAKLNHLERMFEQVNADVFIHSHTHVPAVFKLGSHNVDYKNRKATYKEHLFVNSNAFLLHGGYGEAFGYRPTNTTFPVIILNGYKRHSQCLL